MIVDTIDNIGLYAKLGERIAKALEALKEIDATKLESGRYDVDDDNIYYMVQRYTTKPVSEGKIEAHEKYIDIQYVADGQEILGYSPIKGLEAEKEYDETGDYALYKAPESMTNVMLSNGVFCLLYPEDGHMPCCQQDGPCQVIKVVMKVKIDGI